jgi:hypothetical protein
MPEVRYVMNADKSYSFDQDVLESINTTLTFNLFGSSPLQEDYILPWAYNNLPWVASNYDFQSLTINPNRDTTINDFMTWSEVYSKSTAEEDAQKYFDIKQTINMPTWRISFFENNNNLIGQQNVVTTKRLRQTWGLSPLTGSITMKSMTPFPDPYLILNKTYADFNGAIQNATVNESYINSKKIYELSLSWIGGTVDPENVPTYNLNG